MKIGIDYHGVIDTLSTTFAELSRKWIDRGHEVHIVTGKQWRDAEPRVRALGISFTHHYSIVDDHRLRGTPMIERENGFWMEEETWNRSKGEYCERERIDVHFDNDLKYARYFPERCTFVWVQNRHFESLIRLMRSI
jgi:hydroxymethylpyrimidine pyrophosphatase-like HAD family hydrolase